MGRMGIYLFFLLVGLSFYSIKSMVDAGQLANSRNMEVLNHLYCNDVQSPLKYVLFYGCHCGGNCRSEHSTDKFDECCKFHKICLNKVFRLSYHNPARITCKNGKSVCVPDGKVCECDKKFAECLHQVQSGSYGWQQFGNFGCNFRRNPLYYGPGIKHK